MDAILEVDVPDAELGFMLIRQLRHGAVLERDVGDGSLHVHLDHALSGWQLAEVLDAVERWLRLDGVPRTVVKIGEKTYQLIA
jgi:hypothetical protein